MKFCKDCAHYWSWKQKEECVRPIRDEIDPVSGPYTVNSVHAARRERASEKSLFGRQKCGPEGRYYMVRLPLSPPRGKVV